MLSSSVETEILQAENDIKSLQAKLNDIASNHQEQEVHIFQTIQTDCKKNKNLYGLEKLISVFSLGFSRRGIAHLQSRQSGLTDEVRTNREHLTRQIKDQIQQRREKIRQLSAVEQFAKRNFSEFKNVTSTHHQQQQITNATSSQGT